MCQSSFPCWPPFPPIPLNKLNAAIDRLSTSAQGIEAYSKESSQLGIATTPDGAKLIALVGDGFFSTEVGEYKIIGSVSVKGNIANIEATLKKDSEVVRAISWSMAMPSAEDLNPNPMLVSVEFSGDEGLGTRSSFEDCIKRHAPSCAAGCYIFGGLIPGCLELCAVGVAACCLINTSC